MKYLKELVKTLCVDDKNKPNEVKSSEWVKKGQEYTIIATARNKITNELMFQLAEISISNPEFWGYKATRFAIAKDDLVALGEHVLVELEDLYKEELITII
jgi:hypothetical protein